ncbi:hypothetical protein GCM10009639_12910 [Kitasatospora putterlickiae]|uniref:Uncharacterized protein n=1 Tax=Kitasatospora putterlickiae TaxID=221725 RepID=A0ABP4ICU5_9ACTN
MPTPGMSIPVLGPAPACRLIAGSSGSLTLPPAITPEPVAPVGVAVQVELTPVSETVATPRSTPSESMVAEALEVPACGSPAVVAVSSALLAKGPTLTPTTVWVPPAG